MKLTEYGSTTLTISRTHPTENFVRVSWQNGEMVFEKNMKIEASIADLYTASPSPEEWREIEIRINSRKATD